MNSIPQDDTLLKRCPRCPEERQWHPATTEFFRKNKNTKDGLQGYCKICQTAYQKVRDTANREIHLYQDKQDGFYTCTSCHTQKPLTEFPISRSMKNGRKPHCRVCYNTEERVKREQNPEKHRVYDRVKRTRRPEHQRELRRRRWLNDPERHRGYSRNHYLKNTKLRLASSRKWMQQNPNKMAEISARRRARQKNAQIGKVSYQSILKRDGYWCHICEQAIDPHRHDGAGLSFDHVIPLARGGAHAENNIKPAHRVCNNRKKTKLVNELDDFARRGV